MASARKRVRSAPAAPPAARAFASALSTDQQVEIRELLTRANFEPLTSVGPAVTAARGYDRDSWFVGAINGLRKAFYNDGLRFCLERKDDDTSADPEAVDQVAKDWIKEQRPALTQFVSDAWDSWIVTDNLVANWEVNLCCLKVENCEYYNDFGLPLLFYIHQMDPQKLRYYKDAGYLTEDQRANLGQNSRLLVPKGKFRVLARTAAGWGFAIPRVSQIRKAMTTADYLETGDIYNAWITRYVWELHKLGHEITAGQFAGMPTHFWKKTRADAFARTLENAQGHLRRSVNFDHKIEFPYPDMARFNKAKYENVTSRLIWWGMPFGHALVGGSLLPFYDILRAIVESERALMKLFLETVLNSGAIALPDGYELELHWSRRLLRESKVAADLLKTALTAGLSQETFLDEAGFHCGQERGRKREEAKLPRDITAPTYDPNHGDPAAGDNGGGAGIKGGRPNGTPDPK